LVLRLQKCIHAYPLAKVRIPRHRALRQRLSSPTVFFSEALVMATCGSIVVSESTLPSDVQFASMNSIFCQSTSTLNGFSCSELASTSAHLTSQSSLGLLVPSHSMSALSTDSRIGVVVSSGVNGSTSTAFSAVELCAVYEKSRRPRSFFSSDVTVMAPAFPRSCSKAGGAQRPAPRTIHA